MQSLTWHESNSRHVSSALQWKCKRGCSADKAAWRKSRKSRAIAMQVELVLLPGNERRSSGVGCRGGSRWERGERFQCQPLPRLAGMTAEVPFWIAGAWACGVVCRSAQGPPMQ